MNLSTLLKTMKQAYPFHIHNQVPTDGGYNVDTNWGPKFVSIEQDEMLLHWSFLWREELARKGLRLIDRFIRTRDGAPFSSVGQDYIVVRDHLDNQHFSFSSLEKEVKLHRPMGQLLGMMYRTMKELDRKYADHINFIQWKQMLWNTNSNLYSEDKIAFLKKFGVKLKENMFILLVKSNWKQLEQRWKHAQYLWQKAQTPYVAPFEPNLKHYYLFQNKWIGYYAKTLQTTLGLQGVARIVQELYSQSNGYFENLQDWLVGFEEIYRPSVEEHYEILAWIIYPQQFFKIVELYAGQRMNEEECAQAWVELCHEQRNMDTLQQWYAERIDQLREDAVSI